MAKLNPLDDRRYMTNDPQIEELKDLVDLQDGTLKRYQKLFDVFDEMIGSNRLNESDIPDDWQAVQHWMEAVRERAPLHAVYDLTAFKE